MMYDESKKYKDVPLDSEVFTYLDKYDKLETEKLGMLLANLSMPKMCLVGAQLKTLILY